MVAYDAQLTKTLAAVSGNGISIASVWVRCYLLRSLCYWWLPMTRTIKIHNCKRHSINSKLNLCLIYWNNLLISSIVILDLRKKMLLMYWSNIADWHSNWKISVCSWHMIQLHGPSYFHAAFSISVFNDGNNKELLNINGTIPVVYKSKFFCRCSINWEHYINSPFWADNTYHIPICIWLMDTHPYNAPLAYVRPTADMQIKVSMFVDHNGKIYLPYLHDWNPVSVWAAMPMNITNQTITISIMDFICSHRRIYWVSFKWWLLRSVNIHQFMQSQKNRLHRIPRSVSHFESVHVHSHIQSL